MKWTATPLAGMYLIEGEPRTDERGSLERLFCAERLSAIHPGLQPVQINLTQTYRRGTVRGLHLQHPPAAECKLIRCLRGQAFDVTVDLRPGSPTLGRWHGVVLSEDCSLSVLIPEGCAHGVQALSDDMMLLYQHSAPYQPAYEGGVRPDDPDLAIAWPLPLGTLSERDRALPTFAAFQRRSA